jgi:NADH-quinone oxidoreductase subunit M
MGFLDLSPREVAIFVPLILIVFWMGIYPKSFTGIFDASVDNLVKIHQTAMAEHHKVNLAEAGE